MRAHIRMNVIMEKDASNNTEDRKEGRGPALKYEMRLTARALVVLTNVSLV